MAEPPFAAPPEVASERAGMPATNRTSATAGRVAEALAALAVAPEPASAEAPVAEIAGLREEYLPDMAALLAARRGDPVKIEAVSNPADPDDALNSSGALLPSPHATLAGPTFAEWLDATL